jgi:predicted Fe-Mo cluster-binding NifX family protein
MIAPIADCACLIAGGMGRGAYDRISSAGIRAIVTDLREPDAAAIACAEGRIENLLDRLH